MSVHLIHDLVRTGRATPAQGALLLQLRAELQWARLPWWRKALAIVGRVIAGPA